ncbi:MAG: hypothetical protein ACE5GG_02605 [Candidatus Omnitrophota bacterium]
MIEINLLPDDLRSKKKSALYWNNALQAARIGLVILVCAHIILFLTVAARKKEAAKLKRQWSNISEENTRVSRLNEDISSLRNRDAIIGGLVAVTLPDWPQIWYRLGALLPKTAWFKSIQVIHGLLDIRASILVISGNEVEILNDFLHDVREEAIFRESFDNLDIISIVRKDLSGVEIIDFSIKGVLKKKAK